MAMQFAGAVEQIQQGRISGWAAIVDRPGVHPELSARFSNGRSYPPTQLTERGDGLPGFIFDLPEELRQMEWRRFVDEFDGIFVHDMDDPNFPGWKVPLFKSVLHGAAESNQTVVLANRLRDYAIAPRPSGRLAAYTMAYNEHTVLPLWARYYAEMVGPENVFIIDQGSDRPYDEVVPAGVNIVRLPREMFDNWLIARIVATFQRFLLESYDTVLYSDSDEFVCADPAVLEGRSVAEYLLGFPEPLGITTGFNLCHDLEYEPAYDPRRPVLDQRRFLRRERTMDKPLVTRFPVNWVPGFHHAREGGTLVPGLYLLHLRWFDLDHALEKGNRYRTSKWNPLDVEQNLASYQRDEDVQIVNVFRGLSMPFAALREALFDPAADATVVPEWMRLAIRV